MSTDRPWGSRQSWAAVGITAIIAGLGGAAIYAATDTSSPQFPGSPGAPGPRAAQGPPAAAPDPG